VLDRLADLARETSSERRRELLNGVCDLFLAAETPTREQGDLFGDIVRRVLEDVTTDARAEFSGRVAHSDTVPVDIVRQLATDSEITVAAPVLRHSTVLSEDDLIEIASQHGQGHLLAISNRANLPEGVTDVLVARGDTSVLRTVTNNTTARFSLDGFRQLVDKAARDEVIRSALQRRTDMPQAEQARLADTVRKLIAEGLQGVGAGAEAIDRVSREAMKRIDQEVRVARRQRLEARVLTQDIKDGKLTLSEAVTMLADADRQYDLAQVFSDMDGVAPAQVFRVLISPDASGLSVLCKSHEIDAMAFSALTQMRRRKIKITHEQARAELTAYTSLPVANAQRAMRFLKVRQAAG
jgi:uncharacterized protein (DUF2336 family)